MTLKERLKAARKRAEDAKARADVIINAAVAEDGTTRDLTAEEVTKITADMDEMDAALAEIPTIERMIAAEAAAAPAANSSANAGHNGGTRMESSPGERRDLSAFDTTALVMRASIDRFANSMLSNQSVPEILEAAGYASVADRFFAADPTNQTTTPNLGGITVPDELLSDMIDSLREDSVFLAHDLREIDMPRGNARKTGAEGTVAGYGTEGNNTLVTSATFRDVDLQAKRLAATITPSVQLLSWSLPNVRNAIVVDLRGAMVETMDINAMRGATGGDNPIGLRFIAGIPVVAEAGATAGFADVDAELEKMLTRKRNAKIKHRKGLAWTMTPRTVGFLRSLKNGQGVTAYPEMQGAEGSIMLKGYKVNQTSLLPDNLGAGTNESEIFLVQAEHVIHGKAEGMSFKVSDSTAIVHSDGTVHSMFQQGRIAIQTELWHDLDIEHAAAVQVMNQVTWGA